jgi:hypothetical protein
MTEEKLAHIIAALFIIAVAVRVLYKITDNPSPRPNHWLPTIKERWTIIMVGLCLFLLWLWKFSK